MHAKTQPIAFALPPEALASISSSRRKIRLSIVAFSLDPKPIACVQQDAHTACLFRPVDVAVLHQVRLYRRPRLVFSHAEISSHFCAESLVERRPELDLVYVWHWEKADLYRLARPAVDHSDPWEGTRRKNDQ